jgi:hypothetical protein
MDDQTFTQQEQTSELTGLKDRTLPVLPGDDQANLERRPLPVGALTQRVLEDERLPRIKVESRHAGKVDGFGSSRTNTVRR